MGLDSAGISRGVTGMNLGLALISAALLGAGWLFGGDAIFGVVGGGGLLASVM